jgi:uncharacterized glyoxalase superfamily protein PhnB
MKITELRPMFLTEDLRGTVDFYAGTLGFRVREVNDDWDWATLWIDEVAIMIARSNEHTSYEKICFTGSFYFTTDEGDRWWEKLKDKTRVCYGIENFEYGMREFAIYDNNGYLLQVGKPI